VPPTTDADVRASVLLISGCQDNQTSADGDRNGLFTQRLREVWNDGRFDGDYVTFHRSIVLRMPAWQSPNRTMVGAPNAAFEHEHPFTLTG
jgi:metacaspase-1